jgi:hypothetical protein
MDDSDGFIGFRVRNQDDGGVQQSERDEAPLRVGKALIRVRQSFSKKGISDVCKIDPVLAEVLRALIFTPSELHCSDIPPLHKAGQGQAILAYISR